MRRNPTTGHAKAGDLWTRMKAGDRRALARAMSLVENEAPAAQAILEQVYASTGTALRIGVTGPPGSGKSSLVAVLVARFRTRGMTVGVVAVDPTSPFTGGALLGDRVRMQKVSGDPGVFIRSMATRGSLGGLARTTTEICDILDAFGQHVILIETVGVGQSEVEVVQAVDTTVIVLSPESGDGIQAMKAGLMEAGDVFVVNKADREGAAKLARDVRAMLELSHRAPGEWDPPVLLASALKEEGVDAIVDALLARDAFLRECRRGDEAQRARITRKVRLLVEEKVLRQALWTEGRLADLASGVEAVRRGETTPYAVARDLVATFEEGR